MMIALVLLVAVALLVLVHWYVWRRTVRDVSVPGGRWRRTGTVLAVLLPLLSLAALVGGRALPLAVERWFAWPGYLWLAVLLYLVLGLLVGEAVRPLLMRVGRRAAPQPEPEPEPEPEPVAAGRTAPGPAPASLTPEAPGTRAGAGGST